MKAFMKNCAFLLALVMLFSVAVSCHDGPDVSLPPQESSQSSDSSSGSIVGDRIFNILVSGDLSVVRNGNVFELYVPNTVTVLQLTKYVSVADGISWLVATDVSMQQLIINKIVSLGEGLNTFYVYCHDASESVMENYVLHIHRTGSYPVTFEGLEETQMVVEGGFATQPSGTPSKEGYSFDGWDFDFTKPVTGPVAVAAKWTPRTYVITYDPNLGTMTAQTQTVTYGEEVTLLIPQREGFVFADWFLDEECVKSGVWLIASDVTLKARWASESYTVTFDPNGGSMEGATVIAVSYGDAITFPVPTRSGYTFGGWYDGDTLCFDGVYEYTKDLNLKAKWNQRSATLTFFENGGTKNSYTETLTFGSDLPVPVRAGYTFGGWFKDEALTAAVKTVPDASMRLYAWWTEEGKPGEFIYEASGLYYKITGRTDKNSNAVIPAYIGGRRTIDAIPKPNPDAGVILEKDTLVVKIDRTVNIVATFVPQFEGDDTVLSYVSSKPDVATVDQNGVVKGLKADACVITVKNEATGMSAECIIIVASTPKNEKASLSVTPSITLKPSTNGQLETVYVPEYEDDSKTLTFTSSEPTVATVDGSGKVSALTEGQCNIVVRDSYEMVATCVVTVTAKEEGIKLKPVETTIAVGWTVKLEVEYTPENADDGTTLTLTWESSTPSVATVENGVVTAHAEGECIITVWDADKKHSASVKFTVQKAGIHGVETKISLKSGDECTLNAYFLPEKMEESRELVYTYEGDQNVATLTGNVLTAIGAGSCKVKIASKDGKYTVTVEITVTADSGEEPGPAPQPDAEGN